MQATGSAFVRPARPSDAAGVAAIGKVAVPETYASLCHPTVIRSIVDQSYAVDALRDSIGRCARAEDALFLVAERRGSVVGFLHYDCDGPRPELHRIYVDGRLKRRGIGAALLEALHASLDDGDEYVLMVVADNRPAVAFYERHGLTCESEVDGVAYMREHMGVDFPDGTPPVPALVLRFEKHSTTEEARHESVHGGAAPAGLPA